MRDQLYGIARVISPLPPRLIRIAQFAWSLLGQFSCTVTRSGAPAAYAWGSHHVRALSRYISGPCCYHHSSSNGRVPPLHPHSTLHSSVEPSWDLCCLTQAPLDDVQTHLDSIRSLFSRPPHPRCSCASIWRSRREARHPHWLRKSTRHSSFTYTWCWSSGFREPGLNLALVVVGKPIPWTTISSLFPRISVNNIAEGCVALWVRIYPSWCIFVGYYDKLRRQDGPCNGHRQLPQLREWWCWWVSECHDFFLRSLVFSLADMSPATFDQLASPSVGVISINWSVN